VERAETLGQRALEGSGEGHGALAQQQQLGSRVYEGVERAEALCQRALDGIAEKSETLEVVSQFCSRIDKLNALCQSALEGRLEPSELSKQISGSVAKLDAFCDHALGGDNGGAGLSTAASQLSGTQDKLGLRTMGGNIEQSPLAAKFSGKLQALDKLCEKALEDQVDSHAAPPQLCGRLQTSLPPICENPAALARNFAPAQLVSLGDAQDPAVTIQCTPLHQHTKRPDSMESAGRATTTPMSAGTLDEVTPNGNTCTTPAMATSPDALIDTPEELMPRLGSLVSQLYGITPRFLDMSEDLDIMAATQGDHGKQIENLRSHLVATQDELASLKHRLRSWMDTIRQLHTLQRGGRLRAASAPPGDLSISG